jgi:phage anti-repressor protein
MFMFKLLQGKKVASIKRKQKNHQVKRSLIKMKKKRKYASFIRI